MFSLQPPRHISTYMRAALSRGIYFGGAWAPARISVLHSPAASARTTETVMDSLPAALTGASATAKTAKLLITARAALFFHSLDSMGIPACLRCTFDQIVPPSVTRQTASTSLRVPIHLVSLAAASF
jgi:hypothetical protein